MSESETPNSPTTARPGFVRLFLQAMGALFLLLIVFGLGVALAFEWWARHDGMDAGEEAVRFEVRRGDSLRTVARRLEEQRISSPEFLNIVLAVRHRLDRRIQPGVYSFAPGTAPLRVLREMAAGQEVPAISVTIPEGWTVEQIARRLETSGAIRSAETFLSLCGDSGTLAEILIPGEDAQGFLFPDTYRFLPETSEAEALQRLTRRFRQVLAEESILPGLNSPHARPLTCLEYVTLASIIEREARGPEEMPLISSVFHNRLKKGMRLDSCATVRYALGQWETPLLFADLEVDSPYNTYRIKGLPPGPICNPGRAALVAAFRPDESDFLYYVYGGEGRHVFSRTLREHEKNARAYHESWKFSAAAVPAGSPPSEAASEK
ncbi:endolytic transglycosylase MltG [bacterium]|nr:endolytic transglycosylase MltG [bacterium]